MNTSQLNKGNIGNIGNIGKTTTAIYGWEPIIVNNNKNNRDPNITRQGLNKLNQNNKHIGPNITAKEVYGWEQNIFKPNNIKNMANFKNSYLHKKNMMARNNNINTHRNDNRNVNRNNDNFSNQNKSKVYGWSHTDIVGNTNNHNNYRNKIMNNILKQQTKTNNKKINSQEINVRNNVDTDNHEIVVDHHIGSHHCDYDIENSLIETPVNTEQVHHQNSILEVHNIILDTDDSCTEDEIMNNNTVQETVSENIKPQQVEICMSDSDSNDDSDTENIDNNIELKYDNEGMIDKLKTSKLSEIAGNVDNSHQIVIDEDTDGSDDDSQYNEDVGDIIYHKKPSGRPPKGKIWNTTTGLWIENIDIDIKV